MLHCSVLRKPNDSLRWDLITHRNVSRRFVLYSDWPKWVSSIILENHLPAIVLPLVRQRFTTNNNNNDNKMSFCEWWKWSIYWIFPSVQKCKWLPRVITSVADGSTRDPGGASARWGAKAWVLFVDVVEIKQRGCVEVPVVQVFALTLSKIIITALIRTDPAATHCEQLLLQRRQDATKKF